MIIVVLRIRLKLNAELCRHIYLPFEECHPLSYIIIRNWEVEDWDKQTFVEKPVSTAMLGDTPDGDTLYHIRASCLVF